MSRSSMAARKRRRKQKREQQFTAVIDPETALDIIDDDLPDGAYWALLEEMTGMEPAEISDFIERQKP